MPVQKLTKLELQIMEALWSRGLCSIREIQESFPVKKLPAYTTIQTTVYRMEEKRKIVRRVKKNRQRGYLRGDDFPRRGAGDIDR